MFFLLMFHSLRQPLGQGEDQRDGMLSHNRPMHIARIGHDDIAGDQLRRHELMHRGSRGMNPAQFLCDLDLFAAERPGNCDISVGNLFCYAVVIGKVYHLELRKFATQSLGKPRRHLPQLEAVMNSNKELHEGRLSGTTKALRHRKKM